MELKNNDFCEKCLKRESMFFLNFSSSSRARAGPIWAHEGPYGLEECPEIHKKIASLGAVKGPVTLP